MYFAISRRLVATVCCKDTEHNKAFCIKEKIIGAAIKI
jgi:hypothetical protein